MGDSRGSFRRGGQRAWNDIIRGSGLLHASADHNRAPGAWDWAGVRGCWHLMRRIYERPYPPRAGRGRRHITPEQSEEEQRTYPCIFPPNFRLLVVNNLSEISRAFEAFQSPTRWAPTEILWECFPTCPDDDNPLQRRFPPLYFHSDIDRHGDTFIYGVVCLSQGNPPELVWTFALQSASIHNRHIGSIFQGVQVGGRGSPHSIIGVSFTMRTALTTVNTTSLL